MGNSVTTHKIMLLLMVITCSSLLFLSGCSRYARTVSTLYQPSATVRGGAGGGGLHRHSGKPPDQLSTD